MEWVRIFYREVIGMELNDISPDLTAVPIESFMHEVTPAAVEAWLGWGRNGGDGAKWESKIPQDLKRNLFGDPPRQLEEKSQVLTAELIAQIAKNDEWPITLRSFLDDLKQHKPKEP